MNLLMVNDAVLELHSIEKEIPWQQYGIEHVFTAENADLAREVLTTNTIDLLLCDIEMPGEDGISLIRWIRNNHYDIDCILLTCHADFTYAKEAISLQCQEYIVLPAAYEHIGSTVARVASKRKERFDASKLQEYGKNWIRQQQDLVQEQKKTQEQNRQPSRQETVEKCAAYIQEHLGDETLNVNEIGSHFYLSPIYLSRIFKQEKGVGINQWIIQKRMELAKELLKDSSLTAITVANHCGYSNYPYFSTVFKKYYGCTPSQYLEKTL